MLRRAFDKPVLNGTEGFTTNGIHNVPFVLGLSKDFSSVSLTRMSVVGPCPHAVAHNEQYRKLIKGTLLRHEVKPVLAAR